MIIAIISLFFYGIIWGVVCNAVVRNKGYDEIWFFWGFFFGIFAFLVAITKPTITNTEPDYTYSSNNNIGPKRVENKPVIHNKPAESMWTCNKCGNTNSGALPVCKCGNTKFENFGWTCIECGRLNGEKKYVCDCGATKSKSAKATPTPSETKVIDTLTSNDTTVIVDVADDVEALKKFKELLDMGAITKEEFDAKKKQLLGI